MDSMVIYANQALLPHRATPFSLPWPRPPASQLNPDANSMLMKASPSPGCLLHENICRSHANLCVIMLMSPTHPMLVFNKGPDKQPNVF